MLRAASSRAASFRDPLPRGGAVDVAVIGGGVIGVFAALHLRRLGKSVLLCEKGKVAAEQSSRNWGWVRCMNRDPAELPLAMEAQRMWRDVDDQLGGAAGFQQSGIAYLCSSEDRMRDWEFWLDIAKAHGLDSHFLSGRQVASFVPSLTGRQYVGALCTPTDGRAEPWTAVPAVAQLAHAEGVQIRERCAVRGLDVSGGVVRGVVTEDGVVAAEQVVLAGGAWSSLLARRHGVDLPQLLVRGTVVATNPLPEWFCGQIKDEKIAMRRRKDGGYTLALANTTHYVGPDSFRHAVPYLPLLGTMPDVTLHPPPKFHHPNAWTNGALSSWEDDERSPFEETRVLDPPPDPAAVDMLRVLFAERFPGWNNNDTSSGKKVPVQRAWAGMIDAMPDVVPVVDRCSLPGLTLAFGMSAHGFGIGPAFGRAVANIILEKDVGHDMSRFRSTRFDDGSKVIPGPGL
jgi:glycine/D-amino acid oxidase-like deaminating enzyme